MDFEREITKFKSELESIKRKNTSSPFKQLSDRITLCRALLKDLKIVILKYGFGSLSEEIQFFKHTKQVPFNHLIYYLKVYEFKNRINKMANSHWQEFIKEMRNGSYQFLMGHIDFVNYIDQGQTHLDIPYFTRGRSVQIMMIHTEDYFYDKDFNTSHDLLLAKVQANKRFIDYLDDHSLQHSNNIQKSKLKWTSSKVALTELIYALYHSGALNNGNLEIKDVAYGMQKLFNFELGDFYKTYSEIKLRKSSRTKFLDELSYRLNNEINKYDF